MSYQHDLEEILKGRSHLEPWFVATSIALALAAFLTAGATSVASLSLAVKALRRKRDGASMIASVVSLAALVSWLAAWISWITGDESTIGITTSGAIALGGLALGLGALVWVIGGRLERIEERRRTVAATGL